MVNEVPAFRGTRRGELKFPAGEAGAIERAEVGSGYRSRQRFPPDRPTVPAVGVLPGANMAPAAARNLANDRFLPMAIGVTFFIFLTWGVVSSMSSKRQSIPAAGTQVRTSPAAEQTLRSTTTRPAPPPFIVSSAHSPRHM